MKKTPRVWVRGLAAVLAPTLLIGAVAACSREDAGGVAFVDAMGESHLLMTDAKKNTLTNDDGMIIEYQTINGVIVTHEDGNPVVKMMEYPCFVHEKSFGRTVLELADFTVKLPRGWQLKSDSLRSISIRESIPKNGEDPLTSMSYAPRSESYDELYSQFQARAKSFSDMYAETDINATARFYEDEFFGNKAFFIEYSTVAVAETAYVKSMTQIAGIVQCGDFFVEVTFLAPTVRYGDGTECRELIELISPK